jgi:hypothetical protein
VNAEEALQLCDCALLCAYIYEYAETPALRCQGWIPWSDPRKIADLHLSPDKVGRLKLALRPKCGLCAEIFFRDAEDGAYVSPTILVFKDTTGVVVDYDGIPQSVTAADWWDNAGYLFTQTSPYTNALAEIASTLKGIAGFPDCLITGHSLGGRLAADLSQRAGKKAITFNATGFHELGRRCGPAEPIRKYRLAL